MLRTENSKKFQKLSDPFFQQRFEIVQDIYKRILDHLTKHKRENLCEIPEDSVVFAQSITPSSAAEANRQHVAAFVTQFGGAMSHMAIVAKAKGIPYVANIGFDKVEKFKKCKQVIVDGLLGRVILNPSEKTLAEYRMLKNRDDVRLFLINLVHINHCTHHIKQTLYVCLCIDKITQISVKFQ